VEALQTGRDVPERSFTLPESFSPIEKLMPSGEKPTDQGEKVAPTV